MRIAYVDGYKIRQTLDTDFNVIHLSGDDATQYSPKFYIPEDQVWIDHRFRTETEYLLEVELDWFGKKNGSYQEIRKLAQERVRKLGPPPKYVVRSSRKEDIRIRYVDGAVVRRYLDPEFVCGGHDLVYEYVPKNEIWIDSHMDKRDFKHVLLHETTERKLMSQGMDYDPAHEFATATERLSRREDGGLYPGEPGYRRGLSPAAFIKQFIISYATIEG